MRRRLVIDGDEEQPLEYESWGVVNDIAVSKFRIPDQHYIRMSVLYRLPSPPVNRRWNPNLMTSASNMQMNSERWWKVKNEVVYKSPFHLIPVVRLEK